MLDDLGLVAGLESLARSHQGIDVRATVERCRLDAHVETVVYRVAQGAPPNVVRHAGATAVRMELRLGVGGPGCR